MITMIIKILISIGRFAVNAKG